MTPAHLENLAADCLCDNGLATLALAGGEKLTRVDIFHLGAEARAVYMLAAVVAEHLPDRVGPHQALRRQVHEFYDTAVQIWADVPPNGDLLQSHRHELEQLCEIAADRVELYNVGLSDRLSYCRCKEEP